MRNTLDDKCKPVDIKELIIIGHTGNALRTDHKGNCAGDIIKKGRAPDGIPIGDNLRVIYADHVMGGRETIFKYPIYRSRGRDEKRIRWARYSKLTSDVNAYLNNNRISNTDSGPKWSAPEIYQRVAKGTHHVLFSDDARLSIIHNECVATRVVAYSAFF